jgi:hypothetical protein
MTRRGWFLGSVGLISLWLESIARAQPALVVVTQKGSPLRGLTIHELRRAYLGAAAGSSNGNRLIPLNLSFGSPERVQFERLVLRMSTEEIGRYWTDRKIRGQPGAPKSVPSVELMRRAVATVPGAIGYLLQTDVGPHLRVVRIDDKGPGDPGYVLESML